MLHKHFTGFSAEIFRSCRQSTAINKVRNSLELLMLDIEPLIQKKFNSSIYGIVTKAKVQGTNDFNDWATLMFTNAPLATKPGPHHGKPLHAHEYTQLSINIDRKMVTAGLCFIKTKNLKNLHVALEKEKNAELFDQIVSSLAGREWVITEKGEGWIPKNPDSLMKKNCESNY